MSATADSQPAVSPENSGIAQLRALLVTPLPDDGIWGWVCPLLVTVFAGVRVRHARHPGDVPGGQAADP
jgi:hypothetical protein